MINNIFLKTTSICSAFFSVLLYGIILFQSISMIEFQYAQIFLFAAETLAVITVVLLIFLVLNFKKSINPTKAKKAIIGIVSVCVIICVLLTGYGWISCYNCYFPENIMNNNRPYIQLIVPYHNILDDYREDIDLEVSHLPGTDYIFLDCYGKSSYGAPVSYKVEYFKSISPFMNMKFRFERMFLSPLSEYDIDVLSVGKEMEIDGVNLTVYIEDNDYAVLIKSFGKTIYASLIKAPVEISIEDFASEIINQFKLFDEVTKEKVFLDIPLSEMI